MSYAQSGEDLCVVKYLRDAGIARGRLLDIGACDGILYSNSLLLIEMGWRGVLVEASLVAFGALLDFYDDDAHDVELVHAAIGAADSLAEWHEHSGFDITGARMRSAASSLVAEQVAHMKRIQPPEYTNEWRSFWQPVLSVPSLLKALPPPYAYVSIDTEGNSVEVLEAMDLGAMGTVIACVEHNAESSNVPAPSQSDRERSIAHCAKHGLTKVLFDNGVNVICAR
jgi:hypothetical protein